MIRNIKTKKANDEYKAEPISWKQYNQLETIAHKTQSYLPHKDVSFLELLFLCIKSVVSNLKPNDEKNIRLNMKSHLSLFRNKHYPYGFKENRKSCQNSIYNEIEKWRKPRYDYGCFPNKYNPIEKTAFIKTVRSCRDYLLSGLTEDAETLLINRLIEVSRLFAEI